ncbi:MAG: PAS domain-containing protein [Elusimicrobia bacterium]|nr:PAS domain-containing protein [Elusimicrobiota bacterium]
MKPAKRGGKGAGARADFLEGLLDSTRLVVYLKDAEGRYLYVNRRYELLACVPREALLGKRDHDFFPPEVADLFRLQDREVAARRTSAEFEETFPLPGGVHSFITEKFPLFDEKGEVHATRGFCTEITSQKNRADESLAEERERLAVTVRSITSGIVATDANGCVILLNPAAEALTGKSQAGAEGCPVDEILQAADAASEGAFGRLVREALAPAGAPVADRDVVIVSARGAKRTVVPSAAAVRDRRGNITGAVLCLRDVTEQRQTDEELFKIRSLESLGFLAGGIAHDFNNLLTGIIGNLELLGEEIGASGPAREMLKDAERICGKATTLSRQLLTFADGGTPVRKTFALGPLLKDTAHLILHGSTVKSLVTAPGNLWPIDGDEAQFTQLLGNLLINAREAMPGGGTVWIRAENHPLAEPMLHLPAGRYVRLTIRDDGPGIAAAILSRVFNPYFSSKARGSGLGLAIVYSVVRRHGGHVWAESTEGKGAVFTVLLPASGKPVPKRPAAGRAGLKKGKGRVLVMDDEAVVADIARKILRRAGYAVSVEREGAAAVAAYRKAFEAGRRFDAVILDMTVPDGMGGSEAAAEILALDPKASMILSSGYSKDELSDFVAAAGRLSFLEKPYTVQQLTRMVSAAIRRRS